MSNLQIIKDPKGFGMFSCSGRQMNEKRNLLKEIGDILDVKRLKEKALKVRMNVD